MLGQLIRENKSSRGLNLPRRNHQFPALPLELFWKSRVKANLLQHLDVDLIGPVPCDTPYRPRKGIDDYDSNGMVSCRMNWSLENGIDARKPARKCGDIGKCEFSSSSYISCNPASDSSSSDLK
ncbi:hypothetical protein ACH5RR_016313 [Cinchona calisaya]|uniref:Uncharacterized protein n=1 Tax=Cinchona calisaya TaxID=153742 RepID=A0ABD2ZVN9_9GENT